MLPICGLLKRRATPGFQTLLRSVVLVRSCYLRLFWSEVVTFDCFGGEDRLGGRGTRNTTRGRTAYCLALRDIFIGFEGRHLLSLESNKAI